MLHVVGQCFKQEQDPENAALRQKEKNSHRPISVFGGRSWNSYGKSSQLKWEMCPKEVTRFCHVNVWDVVR